MTMITPMVKADMRRRELQRLRRVQERGTVLRDILEEVAKQTRTNGDDAGADMLFEIVGNFDTVKAGGVLV